MQIKAVLFDLGGTLIRTADIPVIYKSILESFDVKVSIDQIARAHATNEEEFDVVKGQLELGRDFWIRWNSRVLEKAGVQQDREFLAKKIDELWWEHSDLQVYPDVMVTIAQLKAEGVRIGVVTNGLKSDFQRILRKLKLTNCFDVVVGVDACNKGKPDGEIFLYALDKLGVRPEETVFVGDSVKYDYEGAKRAGIKPLLINREGKTSENVDSISSLTDVLFYI